MMTTNQLAEATNLAPQTIFNYVKEGIIEPDETMPDGRYYFNEDLVPRLILKKSALLLRNATLFIAFDNEEENLVSFEETFIKANKQKNTPIVNSLFDYLNSLKEVIQNDENQKQLLMKIFVAETKDAYQKELRLKREKLEGELIVDKDVTDLSDLLTHRDKLFIFDDSSERLFKEMNEKDKPIVKRYRDRYGEYIRSANKKYCITEIIKVEEQLANPDKDEIPWEPKTGTVKGIFKRAEQTYYRKVVDIQIQEKLSKGYCSLLKILSGDDDSVYRLLMKADSNEYRYIEVFGFEKATPEEQQVIRFLEKIKQVTIHEPRMEESV